MNRFIRIVLWILFFIALYIAVGYFLPKVVYVENKVEINASVKTAYSQVIDLHSWNHWSKWNKIDPEMKVKYVNNGVGKMAGYFWESDNRKVGNGSIMIFETAIKDSIALSIAFSEKGEARSTFQFEEKDGKSIVKWSLKYDLGQYPQLWWLASSMKKNIGRDFEESLTNLKALCEVLEKEREYIVLIDDVQEFNFASIQETVPHIDISLRMGEMYGNIGVFLAKNEAEMAGMPYSRYHLMKEDEIDLECGIPTIELVESSNEILTGIFPKTRCVTVDYYGDYQNLQEGHTAQQWMEKRGIELAGPPMEFYLTDPGAEPDPTKWLTKICYPIH